MIEIPILYNEKNQCCGCEVCVEICPKNAITMREDTEGFQYPEIDPLKCIRCGKCINGCDFKSSVKKKAYKKKTEIYAVKAKNKNIRKISSSGGAFILLSDYILSQGGVIACSVYDYSSHTMNFKIIHNEEERQQAIGSKYLQSNLGNIYQECLQWVQNNPEKKLLFIGMGCQAGAFQKFAQQKSIREKVIIVDMVCHGVPSPKMWKEYAGYLENKNRGNISYLTFKDKRNGWNHPTAMAIVNEKEILLRDYIRIFNSGMALRPSCHKCPYTCIERSVDITIGDFWGIEKTHPEFVSELGVSILMTHSKIGKEIFEKVKDKFSWIQTSEKECLQSQLYHPTEVSEIRETFWKEYQSHGIQYVMHKYGNIPFKQKIYYKYRKLIKLLKINKI